MGTIFRNTVNWDFRAGIFSHRSAVMSQATYRKQSDLNFSGTKCMNRRGWNFRIFAVAFAMLSFVALNVGIAQGQAISGNLTGTVTDASGAAVNGAGVEIVNIGTGLKA